jgi:predicted HD phosphohydrolase
MEPFQNVDAAWAALEAQRGMSEGEAVDFWEHALQTAERLEAAGADDELVAAGLLHDLGDGRVSDAAHAPWAAALVRPLLGERVAWLIEQHAEAKRYLCATEPAYWQGLSPVSQRTLVSQGGLMTADEVARFRQHPWAEDALRLRRADDAGKRAEYQVQQPERFRAVLARVAAG